ncbi:DinB family protein [Lysinibacillus agricola]|uniref:DinB family protein n=2 Tax=Lysinibacillus TaxID=400634 RepID=A0ABX7B0D5_9BACI|nr:MULTISPECIES: DinB family protein [Lysinibacillus]KOS61599.1 metal-dependent hydrolase [Lysinibacillus sp. FJAT-14222]QQP14780.1 DinB family protein [Lysinibacillus agricola]
MQSTIDRLNFWISKVPEEFHQMSDSEISKRPAPQKWSKKEILGHLCDSAINNLERFIKIQYDKQPFVLTSYDQVQWVKIQGYQELPIDEVLNLWVSLNKKIINVIKNIPNERLALQCDVGNNQIMTLQWLIQDYLEHTEHHLKKQILIKIEQFSQ